MLVKNGAISDLLYAGARILECACGPCIGMGQAPQSNGVSLRTFNRNFEGRSGTKSAKIFLASPEVAAISAIKGQICNPTSLKFDLEVPQPNVFDIDDSMVISPSDNPKSVEIIRGPNIKPFPINNPMNDIITGKALIKLPDNITTDHIMPSGASLLPYRSNIPYLSDFCLTPCDIEFPKRAKENNGGFIVAGANYGQGSSREHAALVPLYLGIKGVIAKSFARIHMSNLLNSGILPIEFKYGSDYEKIGLFDQIVIEEAINAARNKEFFILNKNSDEKIPVILNLTDREVEIVLAGGLLNYTKTNNNMR
jgi:aconitate hydratase